MARKTNLMVPLYAFLADALRVAYQVSQHADRMSAATEGRIGLATAKEMERLVEQLHRIDSQRIRTVIPSSRELVRAASRLITTIGIAARYAGRTNPAILEHLARVRRGPDRRSTAAIKFALEMHVALAREYPREVEALLPAGKLEEAARVIERFAVHAEEVKRAREAAAAMTEEQNEIVSRLRGLVSEARTLAAVLFRDERDIAALFVARRTRRPLRGSERAETIENSLSTTPPQGPARHGKRETPSVL